jgi:hypothetical protein
MKKGRVLLMAAAGLLAGPVARAQQVLVQANVAEDTLKTTWGPNRRYFGHLYAGYGLVAGRSGGPGLLLRYGLPSAELQVGARAKRRLSQVAALNLDLRYSYQAYGLAQNQQKTVPAPTQHRRESWGVQQVQTEGSLRLNAGRRGNSVGRYLDLGAWGGRVVATSHTTENDPPPGATSVQTTARGLAYFRRWTGGVSARLGADRLALTARYRLTPAFGPAYAAFPELPRWVVGLEIGWF